MPSLQDQLLKAGLVDKKKAQTVKKQQHKQKHQQIKGQANTLDEAKQLAETALQAKAERSRELNRQQREQAENKAIQAQIRQLIEMNRIPHHDGDIAYQFADQNKIKSILVTPLLQRQLTHGLIAIVKLNEQYELVPTQVSDKIAQRDASYLILLNQKQQDSHSNSEEDDPYADFKVPDDLMW